MPTLSQDDQDVLAEALKRLGIKPKSAAQNALDAGGQAAGAAANTMAANRSVGLQAAVDAEQLDAARRRSYFDQMLAREEDRRASGADALKRYQQANYVSDPNRGKAPGFAGKYSRDVNAGPPLDPAIVAAFREEQERRLKAGDSLLPSVPGYTPFQFDPQLLKAGALEKGLGFAGLGAQAASAVPGSAWKKVGNAALKALKFIF